jgi:secretion/DNA translocation related TadE-like protein
MPVPEGPRPAAQHGRDQSGSATIWALAFLGMAAAVAWIGLWAASAVAFQHHLDGSADLAALAGATALQSGEDACTAARRTAEDNAATVVACMVRNSDVLVSVQDNLQLPFGLPTAFQSAARAGPVDLS